MVFESVVFLFLVHPYDVGDGIILANSTEYLTVRTVNASPRASCIVLPFFSSLSWWA